MKSMKNKFLIKILLLFVVFIFLAALFIMYARLKPYNKELAKRYIKRMTTSRTIRDFGDIQLGSSMEEIEMKFGKPDSYWGSGIIQPEYYLFGGDSIIIGSWRAENGIYSISLLKNGMKVEMSDIDNPIPILTERFRNKILLLDNENKGIKNSRILSLSGDEIPFDLNLWSYYDENESKNITFVTSSYNYALNIIKDPRTGKYFLTNEKTGKKGLHPGDFAGIKLNDDYSNIIECCMVDAVKMDYTFKPIDENAKCGEGNYKVALYVSKKFGDLWYRQNPDGTWSYKDAGVSDRDYDGDVIYNPREANAGLDVKFMGFFEVGGTDKIDTARTKTSSN